MTVTRPASRNPRSAFLKNIPLLNTFAALKMALLPMAIITLFWKDQIGLSLTEILLLQAIFSLATLIMEFPSGYLSDRLGYRFALNLACLLGISGWTTYTLASNFTGVLLAELQLAQGGCFLVLVRLHAPQDVVEHANGRQDMRPLVQHDAIGAL